MPQQDEIDSLLRGFNAMGIQSVATRLGDQSAMHLPEISSTVVEGGHGKAQFAATASYFLCHNETERMVCVGAAGSLAREIGLGEIVVAEATVEHDYQIKFVSRDLPEHQGDAESLCKLRETVEAASFPFRVHFGRIASGDEDVVDSDRAGQLHEITGALCVAWEGSGGARAAKLHRIPFIEIRVVTDCADKQAPMDFQTNVKTAMPNASQLIGAWLS